MSPQAKTVDPKALTALQRFWRRHRRLPTYAEMATLFGYRSKNAAFRLAQKLIDEGYVEKDEGGRLRPRGAALALPLAGAVQAGFPAPSEELSDLLSLDDYLIAKPEASFLLTVRGDSMQEAGILEGDLVIVERGGTPRNGEIIVAHIDGEWTLKYYRRTGGNVELVPANPRYPVLRPRGELNLGGIVRAVMRRY